MATPPSGRSPTPTPAGSASTGSDLATRDTPATTPAGEPSTATAEPSPSDARRFRYTININQILAWLLGIVIIVAVCFGFYFLARGSGNGHLPPPEQGSEEDNTQSNRLVGEIFKQLIDSQKTMQVKKLAGILVGKREATLQLPGGKIIFTLNAELAQEEEEVNHPHAKDKNSKPWEPMIIGVNEKVTGEVQKIEKKVTQVESSLNTFKTETQDRLGKVEKGIDELKSGRETDQKEAKTRHQELLNEMKKQKVPLKNSDAHEPEEDVKDEKRSDKSSDHSQPET